MKETIMQKDIILIHILCFHIVRIHTKFHLPDENNWQDTEAIKVHGYFKKKRLSVITAELGL